MKIELTKAQLAAVLDCLGNGFDNGGWFEYLYYNKHKCNTFARGTNFCELIQDNKE